MPSISTSSSAATSPRRTSPAIAAGRSPTGREMPDRVAAARPCSPTSPGFTPLTEALAERARLAAWRRGADRQPRPRLPRRHRGARPARRRRHLLLGRRHHLLARWRRRRCGRPRPPWRCRTRWPASGTITTPAGTTVQLALKVAVADRCARAGSWSATPTSSSSTSSPGALIDDLAEAEHHAEKGEVVLDPSALAAPRRPGPDRRRARGRRRAAAGRSGSSRRCTWTCPTIDVEEPPPLDEELVRPWLLPAGLRAPARRPRASCWPSCGRRSRCSCASAASTTTTTPTPSTKLDDFVRHAQRIMAGYGGNVLQLTLGDKGAYLYGVFGSPIAHEDDAARAAAAALELRDLERTTARARHPDRRHPRPAAQRHVRARHAPHVRVPRRRGEPLGAADVEGAARGASGSTTTCATMAGDAYIWERLPDLTVKGKNGDHRGARPAGLAGARVAAQDPVRAGARRPARGAGSARRRPSS